MIYRFFFFLATERHCLKKVLMSFYLFKLASLCLILSRPTFALLTPPSLALSHTHTGTDIHSHQPLQTPLPQTAAVWMKREHSLSPTDALELFFTQCQQNRRGKTAFSSCKSRWIDCLSAQPPPPLSQTSGLRYSPCRKEAAAHLFLEEKETEIYVQNQHKRS